MSAARRLGLGIDTGGTFTDAAIVDLDTKKVLVKSKSPTTHHDLSLGILGAVDQILKSSVFSLQEVSLVGISTTLATNSILEGLGGDVGLIGIGWEPRQGEDLGATRQAFIGGSYDAGGREAVPLDVRAAEDAVRTMALTVDAFAVSGIFGVINHGHEEAVKEIINRRTGLPVVMGHELTVELGIVERSVTAVLNARLLSVIREFVDSVEEAMRSRCISAPIMIYKGDGSLMSLKMAKTRPVQTILSGPAASLMGGLVLSGEPTCIVIDMGGTSTDIAFLDEGFPRLSRTGATVGKWRTKVRATDVWTAALGGDSKVGVVDGRIVFGPDRVVPIGVAVDNHPRLLHKIQKTQKLEFVVGMRRSTSKLTQEQKQVVQLLLDKGPMDTYEIVSSLPDTFLPRNFIAELKARGQVASIGLTPTDLLNVAGVFSRGSRIAAELGTEIFAFTYGMDKDAFVNEALDLIGARMAQELLLKFIQDGSGYTLTGEAGEYILDMMTTAARGDVQMTAKINKPVIGIGAPADFFVPRLESILHTKVIIPENHDVGNAVGAVCSQVYDHVTVQVHSRGETFSVLAPFSEPLDFHRMDDAMAEAKKIATEYVTEQVRNAGGTDITTKLEITTHRPRTAASSTDNTLNWMEIRARATGRPDLSVREPTCEMTPPSPSVEG